jgi:hypothetical protein
MTLPQKKRPLETHQVAESRNKEWGYLRIGVYVFTRTFGHENICDIHVQFPRSPKYPGLNTNPRSVKALGMLGRAYFSGPNSSIYDIQNPMRSLRESRNYEEFKDVDADRDLEHGGNAIILEAGNYPHTKPGKGYTNTSKFHIWILGPLLLLDRPYGSLFFELQGPFRRDRAFRPFVLRSSSYSEGELNFLPNHSTIPPDMQRDDFVVEAYNGRLKAAPPVSLPPGALRWEWTVEAVAANLTGAQTVRMSG